MQQRITLTLVFTCFLRNIVLVLSQITIDHDYSKLSLHLDCNCQTSVALPQPRAYCASSFIPQTKTLTFEINHLHLLCTLDFSKKKLTQTPVPTLICFKLISVIVILPHFMFLQQYTHSLLGIIGIEKKWEQRISLKLCYRNRKKIS